MEHTDVERTYCEWTPQHFAINIGECGIMNFNEITSCQCTLLLSVHRLITLLLKYNALHFSLRKIHWCIFVSLYNLLFFFLWRNSPQWASASSFTRFLDHTQRRNKVGRTPLDEWSARRSDLYLTTHNTHDRHPNPGGIRIHSLSRRAAAALHFRPRGQWEQLSNAYSSFSKYLNLIWCIVLSVQILHRLPQQLHFERYRTGLKLLYRRSAAYVYTIKSSWNQDSNKL